MPFVRLSRLEECSCFRAHGRILAGQLLKPEEKPFGDDCRLQMRFCALVNGLTLTWEQRQSWLSTFASLQFQAAFLETGQGAVISFALAAFLGLLLVCQLQLFHLPIQRRLRQQLTKNESINTGRKRIR